MYTMEDVSRLQREVGVEYEEAAALLSRAGGDYRQAVRLYAGEHGVSVEPERVEDGPANVFQEWGEWLRRAFRMIWGRRVQVTRGGETLAAVPLVILMLAVLALPKIAAGSLIVMLFLGFRFTLNGEPKAKIVL